MNRQNIDTSLAESERTQAALAALQQKYGLVSELLEAKPSKNEAFEAFKRVFNEDFMAFANKESSLADEATAVQRLQALEKRLEQFVAFPHTFVKRSIAIGGGFSSGKSAFINSFIAQSSRVLPEGITPVTAIPSYVMASTKISIKGCARTGATVDIAPNLYEQLSHDSQSSRDSMVVFRHLMPSIAVEVPLKAGFEHICLVDTPGYDAAGGQTSGDETTAAEALKNQDAALIWMISAESGTVPSADLAFIEGLELNGRPFYVVLTKADLKPASELEDILDVVKGTLEDEELKPVGISAYSSLVDGAYPSDGQSLSDFFRRHNQPVENLGAELKAELESVFSMYEKAIVRDEQGTKSLMNQLNALDLELNVKVDADVAEELGEKIDEIKQSQGRDFAPIKQELGRVKKAMFAAVKQVLLSLVEDPKSAAELNAVWQQQGRTKRRSQSTSSPTLTAARRHFSVQQGERSGDLKLHQVAKTDDYKEATALLDAGADPDVKDKEGQTPLHHAAEHNAHQTAQVLLDAGADPNAEDKYRYTPLYYAAKRDAHQTAKVLLDAGADPNVRDKYDSTPLHFMALADAHLTAKVLLDAGADPNTEDEDGCTPLYRAPISQDTLRKEMMQDAHKFTPLDYAVAKRDAYLTAQVLLDTGADPNAESKDGFTPLGYAAMLDAHQTAKVLLDAAAFTNATDKGGLTPLHYAALRDAHQTAKVLLAARADQNAKDKASCTPLDYAEGNNAHKTAQLLRSRGGRHSG